MAKQNEQMHTGVFNEAQREQWKPMVRFIAFCVLFCFCYQDLATAYGPDYPTVLNMMYKPVPLPMHHPVTQDPISISSLFAIQEVYAQCRDGSCSPPRTQSFSRPTVDNSNTQSQSPKNTPSFDYKTTTPPRSSTYRPPVSPNTSTYKPPSSATYNSYNQSGSTSARITQALHDVYSNAHTQKTSQQMKSVTPNYRRTIPGTNEFDGEGAAYSVYGPGGIGHQAFNAQSGADSQWNRTKNMQWHNGDMPHRPGIDPYGKIAGSAVGIGIKTGDSTFMVRQQSNGSFYHTVGPKSASQTRQNLKKMDGLVNLGVLDRPTANAAALDQTYRQLGPARMDSPIGQVDTWKFRWAGKDNLVQFKVQANRGMRNEFMHVATGISQNGGRLVPVNFRGGAGGSLGFTQDNKWAYSMRYGTWFKNNPASGFAYHPKYPNLRAEYFTAPWSGMVNGEKLTRNLYIEKYTNGGKVLGHVLGNAFDGKEFGGLSTWSFNNQYFHPFMRNTQLKTNSLGGCASCSQGLKGIDQAFSRDTVMGFAPIRYADHTKLAGQWVPMDKAFGQFTRLKGPNNTFTYTHAWSSGAGQPGGSPFKLFSGTDMGSIGTITGRKGFDTWAITPQGQNGHLTFGRVVSFDFAKGGSMQNRWKGLDSPFEFNATGPGTRYNTTLSSTNSPLHRDLWFDRNTEIGMHPMRKISFKAIGNQPGVVGIGQDFTFQFLNSAGKSLRTFKVSDQLTQAKDGYFYRTIQTDGLWHGVVEPFSGNFDKLDVKFNSPFSKLGGQADFGSSWRHVDDLAESRYRMLSSSWDANGKFLKATISSNLPANSLGIKGDIKFPVTLDVGASSGLTTGPVLKGRVWTDSLGNMDVPGFDRGGMKNADFIRARGLRFTNTYGANFSGVRIDEFGNANPSDHLGFLRNPSSTSGNFHIYTAPLKAVSIKDFVSPTLTHNGLSIKQGALGVKLDGYSKIDSVTNRFSAITETMQGKLFSEISGKRLTSPSALLSGINMDKTWLKDSFASGKLTWDAKTQTIRATIDLSKGTKLTQSFTGLGGFGIQLPDGSVGFSYSPFRFAKEGSGGAALSGIGTEVFIFPVMKDSAFQVQKGTWRVDFTPTPSGWNIDQNSSIYGPGAKWLKVSQLSRVTREIQQPDFKPEYIAAIKSGDAGILANLKAKHNITYDNATGKWYHAHTDWSSAIQYTNNLRIASVDSKSGIQLGSLSEGIGSFKAIGGNGARIGDTLKGITWVQNDKEGGKLIYKLDNFTRAYAPGKDNRFNPLNIDWKNSHAEGSRIQTIGGHTNEARIFGLSTVTDTKTPYSLNYDPAYSAPYTIELNDFLKSSQPMPAFLLSGKMTQPFSVARDTIVQDGKFTFNGTTYDLSKFDLNKSHGYFSIKLATGELVPAQLLTNKGGKQVVQLNTVKHEYFDNPSVLELAGTENINSSRPLSHAKGIWAEPFNMYIDKTGVMKIETQPFTLTSPAAGAKWYGTEKGQAIDARYSGNNVSFNIAGNRIQATILANGKVSLNGGLKGINAEAIKAQIYKGYNPDKKESYTRNIFYFDKTNRLIAGNIHIDASGNISRTWFGGNPFAKGEALDVYGQEKGGQLETGRNLVQLKETLINAQDRTQTVKVGDNLPEYIGQQVQDRLNTPANKFSQEQKDSLQKVLDTKITYTKQSTTQLIWQNQRTGDFEVPGVKVSGENPSWGINPENFGVAFGDNIAKQNAINWQLNAERKSLSGISPLLGQQALDTKQAVGLYAGLPSIASGMRGSIASQAEFLVDAKSFISGKGIPKGAKVISTSIDKNQATISHRGKEHTVGAVFEGNTLKKVILPVDLNDKVNMFADAQIPSIIGGHKAIVTNIIGGAFFTNYTLVQEGVNPLTGQFSLSPVTQAGGLEYKNVEVSQIKSNKSGEYRIASVNLENRTFSLPWSLTVNVTKENGMAKPIFSVNNEGKMEAVYKPAIINKVSSISVDYIGGANTNTIKFGPDGQLSGPVGKITAQHLWDLSPVLVKAEDGGYSWVMAPTIYRYTELQKDGTWQAPGRTWFHDNMGFKLYESINGGKWEKKQVAAQDTRLALYKDGKVVQDNTLHYLVRGLSFVEAGKEKVSAEKLAQGGLRGPPSESGDGKITDGYKLGYNLNYKNAWASQSGIITPGAKDKIPALLNITPQGALAVNTLTSAYGFSYTYKADGKVKYSDITLNVDKGRIINVENGKIKLAAGTYKGTRKLGDLDTTVEFTVNSNGGRTVKLEKIAGKEVVSNSRTVLEGVFRVTLKGKGKSAKEETYYILPGGKLVAAKDLNGKSFASDTKSGKAAADSKFASLRKNIPQGINIRFDKDGVKATMEINGKKYEYRGLFSDNGKQYKILASLDGKDDLFALNSKGELKRNDTLTAKFLYQNDPRLEAIGKRIAELQKSEKARKEAGLPKEPLTTAQAGKKFQQDRQNTQKGNNAWETEKADWFEDGSKRTSRDKAFKDSVESYRNYLASLSPEMAVKEYDKIFSHLLDKDPDALVMELYRGNRKLSRREGVDVAVERYLDKNTRIDAVMAKWYAYQQIFGDLPVIADIDARKIALRHSEAAVQINKLGDKDQTNKRLKQARGGIEDSVRDSDNLVLDKVAHGLDDSFEELQRKELVSEYKELTADVDAYKRLLGNTIQWYQRTVDINGKEEGYHYYPNRDDPEHASIKALDEYYSKVRDRNMDTLDIPILYSTLPEHLKHPLRQNTNIVMSGVGRGFDSLGNGMATAFNAFPVAGGFLFDWSEDQGYYNNALANIKVSARRTVDFALDEKANERFYRNHGLRAEDGAGVMGSFNSIITSGLNGEMGGYHIWDGLAVAAGWVGKVNIMAGEIALTSGLGAPIAGSVKAAHFAGAATAWAGGIGILADAASYANHGHLLNGEDWGNIAASSMLLQGVASGAQAYGVSRGLIATRAQVAARLTQEAKVAAQSVRSAESVANGYLRFTQAGTKAAASLPRLTQTATQAAARAAKATERLSRLTANTANAARLTQITRSSRTAVGSRGLLKTSIVNPIGSVGRGTMQGIRNIPSRVLLRPEVAVTGFLRSPWAHTLNTSQFWSGFSVGLGHILNAASTGQAMNLGESAGNIATMYAATGVFRLAAEAGSGLYQVGKWGGYKLYQAGRIGGYGLYQAGKYGVAKPALWAGENILLPAAKYGVIKPTVLTAKGAAWLAMN
ncbi:MAG: hypothetical protein ABH872_00730, partial [Candidatus Omnitrophota bacterium]